MSEHNPVEKGSDATPAVGSVSSLIREFLGFVSVRGKHEVGRVQERSRHQLELRQLRRDRNKRLEKLGRETIALVQANEIQHPGLERHIGHIHELDGRIQSLIEEGPTAHGVDLKATEE